MHDDGEQEVAQRHSLDTWGRVYLHGFIALACVALFTYIVARVSGAMGLADNPALAFCVTILVLVVFPPIAGSIVLFVLFPMIGKKEAWRGILAWDDRLINEVSKAKDKAQVVIIEWPSTETRTMGVLTARFTGKDGEALGAVYVPTAPQTRLGYIRIVRLQEVEFTNWTLKQWQLYQFTFGAISPDGLSKDSN